MNSAAKDMVKILGDESSLGLSPKTDLFFGRMGNDPIDCVVAYDTPGAPPRLTYKKSTSNYFYVGVSVQVRASKYEEAYETSHQILDYF